MKQPIAIFRALADPTRLRILLLLRAMELSVGELAQVLGQSQPRVSRHVKILADAGIAQRRKEGSWVFLTLGDATRLESLFAAIDAWSSESEGAADRARLAAIQAERAAAAERYFEAQAANWDAIRSLHVAESEVEAALVRAVGDGPLGRIVDVGTGTGRMLALFAGRASSAIGVDRSSEMLRLARAKLAEEALTRAELRQGDMYALPLPSGTTDLVLIHQLLHYAQQPAAAIAEAARLLTPGGRLLIVDFATHELEDLRTRDAHVRLGFSDAQMLGWLDAAGLAAEACATLAGGELTVKIWRGLRPALEERKVA